MAQLIQEAKRFQKLAGILKEAQLAPDQLKAIEDAKSALDIISRISSLDTVAREAIEDVLNNILPGITGLSESLNEENASYTVHLKIDGETVMSRTSDGNLDKKEMSDNLTALESKYKDKYDFSKAEIVVLDPSGKQVGSMTKKAQRYMGWPFSGDAGGYSGDIGGGGFYEGKK